MASARTKTGVGRIWLLVILAQVVLPFLGLILILAGQGDGGAVFVGVLFWIAAYACWVVAGYLLAIYKERSPLGWTLAIALLGWIPMVVLAVLNDGTPTHSALGGTFSDIDRLYQDGRLSRDEFEEARRKALDGRYH